MVSMIFLLALLVMAATTLWIGVDAATHKIPITKKPYGLNNGALAWFFSALVLWIVTFPYYLMRRTAVMQQRQSSSGPSQNGPPIASPHPHGDEQSRF